MANVDDVAAAVIACVGPVDAMKLEKLVYYSQAWHLAITDQPLFSDPIEAWRDGPVVDHLFQQHKGKYTVSHWPTGEPRTIDDRGRRVVALVCRTYGQMTGTQLSELTHAEEPWRAARGSRPSNARSKKAIAHSTMARFYRAQKLGGRTAADMAAGGIALSPDPSCALDAEELRAELATLRSEFVKPADQHPGEAASTVAGNRGDVPASGSSRIITVRSRQRP